MVPCERSCHKEYTHAIWKPYQFWFESNGQGKSFSKVGQGHKVKNYGTLLKVLSQGTHKCNMKALSLRIWKLWPRLKFFKSKSNFKIKVTILVIRSVSDVLRAQSRFVKFVGGEAAGRTPYTFYKPTLGPKYVSNRPYNELITPTTFI